MENNQFRITYNVDMVFCIDVTGSMTPVINLVKNNALNFYSDVMKAMQMKGKIINRMRIRIIAFRDYVADGEDAMLVTNFFNLPEQREEFSKSVNSLVAKGGGDEPEDGLEALAYAIKSPWDLEGMKKRHVIVVWTDASTHELGFGKTVSNYPKHMAPDFSSLTEWWGNEQMEGQMNQSAKRLILYAPDVPYWKQISDSWNQVIHFPSKAGEGVGEYDYSTIVNSIINSI